MVLRRLQDRLADAGDQRGLRILVEAEVEPRIIGDRRRRRAQQAREQRLGEALHAITSELVGCGGDQLLRLLHQVAGDALHQFLAALAVGGDLGMVAQRLEHGDEEAVDYLRADGRRRVLGELDAVDRLEESLH